MKFGLLLPFAGRATMDAIRLVGEDVLREFGR